MSVELEVYESTKVYRYRYEVRISYAHDYTRASDEKQIMKILGGPFLEMKKNSCNDKIFNMINIMSI